MHVAAVQQSAIQNYRDITTERVGMIGIFYLILYGMPVIILAGAGIAGVFSARYFRGYPQPDEVEYQRLYAAISLAIVYPVVACFALVVPTFSEIQKLYGSLINLLWLWALCCFLIGAIFGWTSCKKMGNEQ
jgi:uncharacterized membrane protein